MSNILANPLGAHVSVSDFRTGRDDNGIPLVVGNQTIASFRANAAILQGAAVCFVAATAAVPTSVTPMTAALTNTDPWLFAGVAMANAAAGDTVQVCTDGIVEILFDASSTAAFASLVNLPGTTTGEFDIAAAPVDDVTPVGVVLGGEIGTADKCLARISISGIPVPDEFSAA